MRKERVQEVISENANVQFSRQALQTSISNIGVEYRSQFENLLNGIELYYKKQHAYQVFVGKIISIDIGDGKLATYFEFDECPHGFPPRVALRFFSTVSPLSLVC